MSQSCTCGFFHQSTLQCWLTTEAKEGELSLQIPCKRRGVDPHPDLEPQKAQIRNAAAKPQWLTDFSSKYCPSPDFLVPDSGATRVPRRPGRNALQASTAAGKPNTSRPLLPQTTETQEQERKSRKEVWLAFLLAKPGRVPSSPLPAPPFYIQLHGLSCCPYTTPAYLSQRSSLLTLGLPSVCSPLCKSFPTHHSARPRPLYSTLPPSPPLPGPDPTLFIKHF